MACFFFYRFRCTEFFVTQTQHILTKGKLGQPSLFIKSIEQRWEFLLEGLTFCVIKLIEKTATEPVVTKSLHCESVQKLSLLQRTIAIATCSSASVSN